MPRWILEQRGLFDKEYGHRGSIKNLWEQRWKFPCTKRVYPFHDGQLSDFEPIFQKLIEAGINDPYSNEYTNAFIKTARDLVHEAEKYETSSLAMFKQQATDLYLRANAVYRIARFPFIKGFLKEVVYREQRETYLKGARLWANPITEVNIPFKDHKEEEGEVIPVYIRKPDTPDNGPFPTVLLITGLDGHRPDNTERTNEFLKRGWATVIVDIPGIVGCPADKRDPLSPDRLFDSVLSFIASVGWFDQKRVVAWGLSAGGYYAIRLAHTHAHKLLGAVGHGAGVHHYIGREWLEQVEKHEYPFGLPQAYVAKYGYKDWEELLEKCQDDFSLISGKKEGVAVVSAGKKSCRLLLINGVLDGCMPVEDSMLLTEYGDPKELRLVKDRMHMGYPEANGIVYPWLEALLGNSANPDKIPADPVSIAPIGRVKIAPADPMSLQTRAKEVVESVTEVKALVNQSL